MRTVEVEDDVARIFIYEVRLAFAVNRLNNHASCGGTCGHCERDAVLCDALDVGNGQCTIVKKNLQGLVGVLYKIIARDGNFLSCGCILAAHGHHRGWWHNHMEGMRGGISIAIHHVYLIGYGRGNFSWDVYKQRIVGDKARIEHCFLIVEEHTANTSQIATHQTDGALHVTLGYYRVGTLGQAYVLHLWRTARGFVFVGLVAACGKG